MVMPTTRSYNYGKDSCLRAFVLATHFRVFNFLEKIHLLTWISNFSDLDTYIVSLLLKVFMRCHYSFVFRYTFTFYHLTKFQVLRQVVSKDTHQILTKQPKGWNQLPQPQLDPQLIWSRITMVLLRGILEFWWPNSRQIWPSNATYAKKFSWTTLSLWNIWAFMSKMRGYGV